MWLRCFKSLDIHSGCSTDQLTLILLKWQYAHMAQQSAVEDFLQVVVLYSIIQLTRVLQTNKLLSLLSEICHWIWNFFVRQIRTDPYVWLNRVCVCQSVCAPDPEWNWKQEARVINHENTCICFRREVLMDLWSQPYMDTTEKCNPGCFKTYLLERPLAYYNQLTVSDILKNILHLR